MHVFTATAATETNSFSPIRTGDADFHEWFPAGTHPDEPRLASAPLTVARRECAGRGWRLSEGLCASAQPGGLVRRDTWERIREAILDDLARCLPVDMVLLGLHGAMIADAYPDPEGDLLARVRGIVGSAVPVGALLDAHAHLTDAMVEAADLLIAYKEYPHTDVFDRAQELWTKTLAIVEGRSRPEAVVREARMMSLHYTPVEPMRSFVDDLVAAESEPGIVSASLIHGFPWGDVAEYGSKLLVYGEPHGDAAGVARRFAERLFAARGSTMAPLTSIDGAVAEALGPHDAPLVLGDFSDNVGAGCPGDATHLVGALLAGGVRRSAAAFIFDPVAVQLATAAGVGGRLPLRVGGKACAFSGTPMDLEVEVTHLAANAEHDVVVTRFALGNVAVVRAPGDNHLVLTSLRAQCITPAAFSDFGIDLATKDVFVPKSMQHFYLGFRRITDRIRYVDSPGAATMDLTRLPFRHADRSIWPFTS